MEDFEMDFEQELYGDDYNEEDYDYDWGYNEDEGFDPYMGCYSYDC